MALSLLVAPPAGAVTIDVTTTTDEFDENANACALREAVVSAGADSALQADGCTAGSGDDVIQLPPGTYLLTKPGLDDTGAGGDLDVLGADATTIQGTGPGASIIDQGQLDRVIHKDDAGALTLDGLTVQGGDQTTQSGGGVVHEGAGTMTIRNSTVTDNQAKFSGGGIFTAANGTTLENVTVSGNRAMESGGGLYIQGTTSLRNVTVTANTANSDSVGVGNGGGIDVASGTTTIGDTILGGNFDTDAQAPDCFGTVTSSGNNQIGTSTGCTFGPASGDMFGDPMLAPLADNGGRTPTHALLDGSPAIDSGSTSALPTDQRGAPRAGVADIGAYERVLCRGVVVNRIGTGGNDTLLGTDAADGFLLDAGDDTATGGGGADAFCGGEGNDTLNGEGGNDSLGGEGGNDTVSGGAGNDTGSGDAGQDKLLGGGGKDKLTGLGGNDKLLGGGGRDKLTGGTGRDKLLGQGGRDLLLGGGGRDTLRGGPGRDVLKGGPGKDTQKQ